MSQKELNNAPGNPGVTLQNIPTWKSTWINFHTLIYISYTSGNLSIMLGKRDNEENDDDDNDEEDLLPDMTAR